jgi:hypothetical protein
MKVIETEPPGVKFALLVVSALADHPIIVLNLAGINVVDLLLPCS